MIVTDAEAFKSFSHEGHELARRSEEIALQLQDDDVPTFGIMRLTEEGGAFDFWKEAGEDIYSAEDGEPV